jgi:hypothetical protein
MPFSFTSYARTVSDDRSAPAKPAWSSADVLLSMRNTLTAIADIETRYEIEREQIEQSSGSVESKQREMADLEDAHQHRCEPLRDQWAKLHD